MSKSIHTSKKILALAAAAVCAAAFALPAQANMVTNGSFNGAAGQLGYNTNLTGWTSVNAPGGALNYTFVFASGTADTTGSNGQYGNLALWGPNNGSTNGLPASSPDGGNFIAADGAFQVGALQQTINGLIAGDTYAVSFYWAAAQQSGYTGPTTDQWLVSLGGQTLNTSVSSIASHGFSGWMQTTLNFTATTTGSEVLSFMANGTPTGEPPFALLDGVSMNQVGGSSVPEPASLALVGVALLGGTLASRRKRSR